MCRPMGEITEVHIRFPTGFVGGFVRICVKLGATRKLV